MTKGTYHYLVHKVKQKMLGWKAKTLFLVRRSTLVTEVLSALPMYFMQSTLIPKGKIEKIIQQFVWGHRTDRGGINLMKWEEVCKSMENGGFGIKFTQTQNEAFLMKLGFN